MADNTQTAVRLPFFNKLFFASDHVGLQAIQYFRQTWVLFFLAPPAMEGIARVPDVSLGWLNMDARVLAGFLIFAGRFIDAFTDPIIGWWSDRTHSRWGRRIPFILVSTPFYALFAALIWFLPTEGSSWWNALYFVIMLELFFTAATMSSGPLEALVPEVTTTAPDRMNLVGLIFLFAIVGAGVGLIGGGPIVDALGFKVMAVILAGAGSDVPLCVAGGGLETCSATHAPGPGLVVRGATEHAEKLAVRLLPANLLHVHHRRRYSARLDTLFRIGSVGSGERRHIDRPDFRSGNRRGSYQRHCLLASALPAWGEQTAGVRHLPGRQRRGLPDTGAGRPDFGKRVIAAGLHTVVHCRAANVGCVHAAQGDNRRHRRL